MRDPSRVVVDVMIALIWSWSGLAPALITAAVTNFFIWIFKRDIEDLVGVDLGDGVSLVSELSPNMETMMKEAFAKGFDFQWLVAINGNEDFKNRSSKAFEDLWKVTSYIVELPLRFGKAYGHTILARDVETGVELGAVVMIPPVEIPWRHAIRSWVNLKTQGIPPMYWMDKEVQERYDAMCYCDDVHAELMSGRPHVYMRVLAVSPDAQGKGIGGKLVQAVLKLANGYPVYLDCHGDNTRFYAKHGFKIAKAFTLTAPSGAEIPYYGMIHEPESSQ